METNLLSSDEEKKSAEQTVAYTTGKVKLASLCERLHLRCL